MPSIKPVFKCEEFLKQQFSHSKCLLTVSVGQEVHEGEKFRETVRLVNRSFQSCVVLIDDTLQRHTMAIETQLSSGDALMPLAREEGVLWRKRSQESLQELTIPHEIITWDEWLNHSNYTEKRQEICELYMNDSLYRLALDSTINQFLERYNRRDATVDLLHDHRVRNLCREYLIEECTAMCLWPELSCQFEVYPSHRNAAMTETHKRFVEIEFPNLLRAVRIKFKNKKQLKPQVFITQRAQYQVAANA